MSDGTGSLTYDTSGITFTMQTVCGKCGATYNASELHFHVCPNTYQTTTTGTMEINT